jgi:hypothetical protein
VIFVRYGKWALLAFFMSLVAVYPGGWAYDALAGTVLAAFLGWWHMIRRPRHGLRKRLRRGRHAR